MLRLSPKLTRRVAATSSAPRSHLISRRHQSNGKNSQRDAGDAAGEAPSPMIEHFQKSTVRAGGTLQRIFKWSVYGVIGLGVVGWTAYEGAHMWVERVEMAPERDEDARKWQWDLEAEDWSGGREGGTDRALGVKGRHSIRSAWMAREWGTGDDAPVIGSSAFTGRGSSGAGGLSVIEARLEYAQDFLNLAVSIAEKLCADGTVSPRTLQALLTRHGSALERMGAPDALFEARSQFERVWALLPSAKGADASRTALKIGDLSRRLGASDEALAWWSTAIQLTLNTYDPQVKHAIPAVPNVPPTSPLGQRVLTSTLVSLSAFYATTGDLKKAKAVEEASLNLLRSIPAPPSLAASSPAQALHHLYLLHRSSLISIHLAEVLFALRSPVQTSIQSLTSAAISSERVALALAGLPLTRPDAPNSSVPNPQASEKPLIQVYAKSVSMKRPASSLLRDSRRTAAEAWNLLGILTEDSNAAVPEKALECYERALGWAGVDVNASGGVGEAGEGIPEAEWKALWGNYVRVRDAVRKRTEKET